jgi:hypothetical protein
MPAVQQLTTDGGAGLDVATCPMACQHEFHCGFSPFTSRARSTNESGRLACPAQPPRSITRCPRIDLKTRRFGQAAGTTRSVAGEPLEYLSAAVNRRGRNRQPQPNRIEDDCPIVPNTGHSRADKRATPLIRTAPPDPGHHTHIRLNPLAVPRQTVASAALCQALDTTDTLYPGATLTLRYSVKPTGHRTPSADLYQYSG